MMQKLDLKLVFALIGVAVFWGTTYLAIRIAVHSIPPWYVTTMRQAIASSILLVVLLRQNQLKWIGWSDFKRQFILSVLMLVIANGMTTVAEKTIPSGLTSLLSALTPLAVFVGSVIVSMQKLTLKGLIGVLMGFFGVAFIFRSGLTDLLDPHYRFGIISMFVAIVGWSIGTIYSKKHSDKPNNIFLNLFYQFLISAVIQLGLALLIFGKPHVQNWELNGVLAVVYLTVFGSIVGMVSYYYALKKVSATEVAVLSYFNTIIALFLGWLVLNEVITVDIVIATVLIISGVFITNYKKSQPKLEN